ncbi:MAG: bifunctional (p)ppGpp synthetase/guanosine-3',5'-bis(diphosphate) 3'-pyrophosphohydrolase [Roseofilum sp. SBFL]|uniref:RelA/SpoT family protein n=1 Tax=unclassified Roseofilum TaxID=2620099 RepID=UPI001B211083|nr:MULTISPECIES: bifunctional (p)ppGpp synthetase/guanosine-3',5'-bis(diphosphate) 3'-pyrophosphohydrolase [unclassified Roseofilum]MBP0012079.1 bifunctional (p)ppGpp synthetase/guanosine-3',5'-bis(diphosphate) 3'-pyrophosphohydrolase [Roseofilum sp. SID3]MBP0023505.1 bifunctional (p)ppGpp synthetase/guanosine-3',5'-bis(diphosphate) 3'-pyrophosphohydrolase [Roseofilum sp. SID2]MBP0037647.1 bifunctional (p)ppGpp synthetase/guanosine-3',5'-bis(diphosphate) 3'-pyrophosphohydrolase [Roseofilum sp. S
MKTITEPNSLDLTLPHWLTACLNPEQVLAESIPPPELPEDRRLIREAFEFAYQLHKGQYRKSGEAYISHPVAVAGLLRELGGSAPMIAAGFLHDVVEDTEVTPEELEERFGSEVRQLVEGVTKLSKFKFSSKTERQAENFRRMFLAMAQDIRVIVVKLADRLHNMRTLEFMKEDKQRTIALETREIFAPLANRLGIGRIKWELEDLAFKYLEPTYYREVQCLVAEKRIDRETHLKNVIEILEIRMEQIGITTVEITGRPKHLYGIYRKMHKQQKEFHEIFDIAGIRIITENHDQCYRALAIVHDSFRPIPGRFKDYIGLPKPNRYQSLHTGVIGPTGRPLEVQIRTQEMHQVAEYGIAAHWKYKEAGSNYGDMTDTDEKFTWLRQLLDWQNDLKDAQEYLENIKDNLFEDDVYVFTPRGDVLSLTSGSSTVDFAYRIHSEVGNHCSGARVNGRMVPLNTMLKNGDIVEILTQKNSHPSLDWLNFVKTAGARNRIRQWYKRSHREENVARGRELLEKEMGKSGFEALLKSQPMQWVVERCNYHAVDDLLAALGYGELTLNLVVNRLRDAIRATQPLEPECKEGLKGEAVIPSSSSAPQSSGGEHSSPIVGIEGLLYYLAGCCNPIPGELIIGVVTRGRGISVHRQGCQNVENVEGDRLIPISWNGKNQKRTPTAMTYIVQVQIQTIDRVGILKDILSRLSDQGINVRNVDVNTTPGKPATINLGMEIRDRPQLESVFTQIRNMSDVLNIRRLGQAEDAASESE